MKRLGTVLVFKPGVSKVEAAKALASLKRVLEVPEKSHDYVGPVGRGLASYKERPFVFNDLVHEYDDEWGGPVWYIP